MADVAIVIPTLNEELHLPKLLASMVDQSPNRVAEILVVDGGSSDSTRSIVRAQTDVRVRLVENPARIQAAGVNLGAACAAEDIKTFIRVDAHAQYPDDFVEQLLEAQQETGAASVVTRLKSVGVTPFQRAVAAASNSAFGTGGAMHRTEGESTFVDHGHHALFDRATYVALGGYDETFIANEDAEYDTRLRAAGERIWLTDGTDVRYYPRSTARALVRQYFNYGRGRARTRAKHGEKLRARQVAPAVLVAALVGSLLIALRTPIALLVPAGYLAGVSASTVLLVFRTRDLAVVTTVVALPIMHIAWGSGFIVQASLELSKQTGGESPRPR